MSKEIPRDRILQIQQQRLDNIKKFGFTIDQVFGYDLKTPHPFGEKAFHDIHTHGLREKYDHPELQLIVPVDPQVSLFVLNQVVNERIAKGQPLQDGQFLEGLVQGEYRLKAVLVHHPDDKGEVHERFRILLPDVTNGFPTIEEQPDIMYAYQLEEIDYSVLEEEE